MSYQDAISQAAPFTVLDGSFPAPNAQSPLAARLAECEKQGRAALIGYLPVGFPTLDESIDAAIALGNNGADIIELGVPYSDPVMDGPVIQKATGVALENGFKLPQLFEAVRRITEATDAVVVVMTYWNPVLAYGVKNFARDLAAAGGAGMITPDLVPDEASAWFEASDEYGLDRIFLGRAVFFAGASGDYCEGVERLRVRRVGDGRDRCPHLRVGGGSHPGCGH